MNEEILKRIDALAEKFGTTAEYLWTVLVSDMRHLGGTQASVFAGLAVFSALVMIHGYGGLKGETRKPIEDQSDAVIGGGVVMVLVGLAAMIGCIALFWSGVESYIAPHREALRLILGK